MPEFINIPVQNLIAEHGYITAIVYVLCGHDRPFSYLIRFRFQTIITTFITHNEYECYDKNKDRIIYIQGI
jgi:hypothetical protein